MSRGKPAPSQLDLSNGLLNSMDTYITADGTDARNYGIGDGIPECRKLLPNFWAFLQLSRLSWAGNSSLEHDCSTPGVPLPVRHRRGHPLALLQIPGHARQVPVSRARLRPPLQDLSGTGDRDDSGTANFGRSGHGDGRVACKEGSFNQGILVRASSFQSGRNLLQRPGGRTAGFYGNRCRRFPHLLDNCLQIHRIYERLGEHEYPGGLRKASPSRPGILFLSLHPRLHLEPDLLIASLKCSRDQAAYVRTDH